MKRIIAIILVVFLLISATSALAGNAGTSSDPLISLSYLNGTYVKALVDSAVASINSALDKVFSSAVSKLNNMTAGDSYARLSLGEGGNVTLSAGGSLIVLSGTAAVTFSGGTVINVSTGKTVPSGSVLSANQRYFTAEDTSASFLFYSASSEILVEGRYSYELSSKISGFMDVTANYWGYSYVNYLSGKGIVNGVGNYKFEPDSTMTRAMFVTVIGRLYGVSDTYTGSSSFADVAGNTWYSPYVAWAADNAIVLGYENGNFGTDDPITREQMAVIIVRYANVAGLSLNETTAAQSFADEGSIGAWAREAVSIAQRAGLINGKPGNLFEPGGTATRAEVCAVVYRLTGGE